MKYMYMHVCVYLYTKKNSGTKPMKEGEIDLRFLYPIVAVYGRGCL